MPSTTARLYGSDELRRSPISRRIHGPPSARRNARSTLAIVSGSDGVSARSRAMAMNPSRAAAFQKSVLPLP